MEYRWESSKAIANLAKHGVDFADAVTALEDQFALSMPDPDSTDEERYICLGTDAEGQVLVTVYAYRDEHIRIISSRKASPGERRRYEDMR